MIALTDRWLGRTTIDGDTLVRCDPDEWLLVCEHGSKLRAATSPCCHASR
jgi:hypothetical protein